MVNTRRKSEMSIFERYLTLWVILCIAAGTMIGKFIPAIPERLSQLEYARVSIPVAILIWLMIYPMMLKVDFSSLINATKKPKGLTITTVTNWLIKPFTMYLIANFFLKIVFRPFINEGLATEYLAGAVLLGAAPCTAMVFVWSYLSDGDPAYTVVQVAVNDLIILIAFTPIVALLLGISNVQVPYDTLFLSVALFVVIPLAGGYLSRKLVIKKRGLEYFEHVFLNKFTHSTIGGLLLTLIIHFSFQGKTILSNPLHILFIAVPLIIQTFFIFIFAYGWAKLWKVPHSIAAPGAMIGASNFFELSVAVAVSLFGLTSGAALATVVGVLVEVPVMLTLVKIAGATEHWFPKTSAKTGISAL
ncbi:MAG: ACR3 family arsenite efflux transporter [Spirochaetales bacterium]|jgi:ACR3 family arsenite transporter|nr:ACR3 family arsenite efflux transporter [Spirochaetales bacterium]